MPWMNFDLQDGKAPIGFNLKPDDCERFMEFLAECQALKESSGSADKRPYGMRPDYCPVGNEPCQSLCDVPCGKTDYQSLLREVLTHFYHDGVPTDPEHPKRITVNKIEKALK